MIRDFAAELKNPITRNGMTRLRALKVTVEAAATSFRYPHFLIGRQVSYDMPPPSTIYGHVASALGELPSPTELKFGYDFRFSARASDLEHQHIITAGGAKFQVDGRKRATNTQATVQPHLREFLFRPRLTLYLQDLSLAPAFRSPAFCVILGRSQDLASYTNIEEVELRPAAEHTSSTQSYRFPTGPTLAAASPC